MKYLYRFIQTVKKFQLPYDLKLVSQEVLVRPEIAYETYGELNEDKSNAVLICHGFTADQFVASKHPITGKDGWWSGLVGPGLAIDTNRYFVIATNVLGGSMGSTSPCTLNPETDRFYTTDFPIITITDMMNAQLGLLDYLGIDRLLSAIGGSMGGMQVLELARIASHRVQSVIAISCSWRYSAQNIAFNEIGRQAVMSDPKWQHGQYIQSDDDQEFPIQGLALARMVAHITYMSEESLQEKFGRNLQNTNQFSYHFDTDFQVESYLRYQGSTFVERFDANCYLYLTRALDYFDLTKHASLKQGHQNACLAEVYQNTQTKFCIISFTSDWLFPPSESKDIVRALNAIGAEVSYMEIHSDKGHDAFLLNEPEMIDGIRGFLTGVWHTNFEEKK